MKKLLVLFIGLIAGGSVLWALAAKHQEARDAAFLATQRAAWDQEKTNLEAVVARLKNATEGGADVQLPTESSRSVEKFVSTVKVPTPEEIIEKLQNAKDGKSSRTIRFAIQQLENLIQDGTNAVPAIAAFLKKNQDIVYGASSNGRGARITTDFVVPPTLRIGLFDALKQIGGAQAAQVLAEALQSSDNVQEIAYLSSVLQGIAPGQYQDAILAATHQLLTSTNLDRNQRNALYGILSANGDTSLVAQAQKSLVQPDGQIDRSALRYLQQTLGAQSVPIAAAAYTDSRVSPDNKESLAQIGLDYAGVNQQANQFWAAAVADESLPLDVRAGLIKDLGQDGINEGNPSAAVDLPIIEARLQMIQNLTSGGSDPRFEAALTEAQKDLLRLLAKVPKQ